MNTELQQVLYFNGLERTGVGLPEKTLIRYLKLRGIELTHGCLDWHSDKTFNDLFDTAIAQAKQQLRQHGCVALVGASAGGSLAVNVFQYLRTINPEAHLSAISLSGRLSVGNMEHLEHSAMQRTDKKPSPAFIDSVTYCDMVAIPDLTDLDKKRIRVVKPLADNVVPLANMDIKGVTSHTVPAIGHLAGITLAALRLPAILNDLQPRS